MSQPSYSRAETSVPPGVAEVHVRLRTELARVGPSHGLDGLEFVGAGMEFVVFRGRSAAYGDVAVRCPRARWLDNHHEVEDSRLVMAQETRAIEHLRRHGLPAPAVHDMHLGEHCDFLVMDFVQTDRSQPSSRLLGELAGRLHACAVPEWVPLGQRISSVQTVLGDRILRRAETIRRLSGRPIDLPPAALVRDLLSHAGTEVRLLHMDFRPANLLTRGGQVHGIIDWSNALNAHPSLEIARIEEYGLVDEAFAAAYRAAGGAPPAPPAVRLLYRFDAASMLAVVFLSEDRRDLAAHHVTRCAELAGMLRDAVRA